MIFVSLYFGSADSFTQLDNIDMTVVPENNNFSVRSEIQNKEFSELSYYNVMRLQNGHY